jgi:hypothetical protein
MFKRLVISWRLRLVRQAAGKKRALFKRSKVPHGKLNSFCTTKKNKQAERFCC